MFLIWNATLNPINTIRKKAKSSLGAHTQPKAPRLPANPLPGFSFRCGKILCIASVKEFVKGKKSFRLYYM